MIHPEIKMTPRIHVAFNRCTPASDTMPPRDPDDHNGEDDEDEDEDENENEDAREPAVIREPDEDD
jgi:hypothetical protein